MLECLAHTGIGRVPRTHLAVEIAMAAAVTVKWYRQSDLSLGWESADLRADPGP